MVFIHFSESSLLLCQTLEEVFLPFFCHRDKLMQTYPVDFFIATGFQSPLPSYFHQMKQ